MYKKITNSQFDFFTETFRLTVKNKESLKAKFILNI